MFPDRVVSGMRPTGALHLGHYHGALKNWVRLQTEYPCLFFVADWHALTTHYESSETIEDNVWEMVIDWLAAGLDPEESVLFMQSRVPEHAELMVLLSMVTPLGWLERVPTYKDQQDKLADKDLATCIAPLMYRLVKIRCHTLNYRAKSHVGLIIYLVVNPALNKKRPKQSRNLAQSVPSYTTQCAPRIRKRVMTRRWSGAGKSLSRHKT